MSFIEHNGEPGKPRAIETLYAGYRFRSRLEARWGVFFDALGLQWEYEPEGFDLDGVWYLPDFRVKTPQGADIWYEIKPKSVKKDEKFSLFARKLYDTALEAYAESLEGREKAFWSEDPWDIGSPRANLLSGDPLDVLEDHFICPRCGFLCGWSDYYSEPFASGGHFKRDRYFQNQTQQFHLGAVSIDYGASYRFSCIACDVLPGKNNGYDEPGIGGVNVTFEKGYVIAGVDAWEDVCLDVIQPAALKARQARFEHGEKP